MSLHGKGGSVGEVSVPHSEALLLAVQGPLDGLALAGGRRRRRRRIGRATSFHNAPGFGIVDQAAASNFRTVSRDT